MPPSHKKIYIPLSLVHLIYTAGDKCMCQNACFNMKEICGRYCQILCIGQLYSYLLYITRLFGIDFGPSLLEKDPRFGVM